MAAGVDQEARVVEEIRQGADRIYERLEKDVVQMCTLLKTVIKRVEDGCQRLSEGSMQELQTRFRQIFWALKLHIVFYYDAEADVSALNEVGHLQLVNLTDQEMRQLPGPEYAIDPVSILLEIVSL